MEDNEVIAMNLLRRDVLELANAIADKRPGDIDFAAMQEYLDLLKAEAKRVEDGIYARDNSITYTSGKISFDKDQKTM